MPELRIFVEQSELARQMANIIAYGASQRYDHELDALVEFLGLLDDEVRDAEFTERAFKLFRDRMEDIEYESTRILE